MRVLKTNYGSLDVIERDDYTLYFGITRDGKPAMHEADGKPYAYRLFCVCLDLPCGIRPFHVLAEDKAGAISQADCIARKQFDIPRDCEGVNLPALSVERIPFGIRGWSGNQF